MKATNKTGLEMMLLSQMSSQALIEYEKAFRKALITHGQGMLKILPDGSIEFIPPHVYRLDLPKLVTKSRNKREGRYCGQKNGMHQRIHDHEDAGLGWSFCRYVKGPLKEQRRVDYQQKARRPITLDFMYGVKIRNTRDVINMTCT